MPLTRACIAVLLAAGCDCGGPSAGCMSGDDCPAGSICVDEVCVPRPSNDAGPDAFSADAPVTPDAGCAERCGGACCDPSELCFSGACVEDLGPCTGADDCDQDSRCEPSLGRCVPWEDGGSDGACTLTLAPGLLRPVVQCAWTGPAPGDPYPDHDNLSSLPLVVDFAIARAPGEARRPSIVFIASPSGTTSSAPSVLRIVDGASCAPIAVLDDDLVQQDSTPAAGDLDGDGRAEIVAQRSAGGLVAWRYDDAAGDWVVHWRSGDGAATGRHNLAIGDVNRDGTPDVIAGTLVYSGIDGSRLGTSGAGPSSCGSHWDAAFVADVDLDGEPEVVSTQGVFAWDATAGDLALESYWVGPGGAGFPAVADFGDFPGAAGDAPGRPEIVCVEPGGRVRIVSIGGETLFDFARPGGGDGGPPTIADYDGDGVPEIGVAGVSAYTVLDPCCGDATRPGACASGRADGVLWSAATQENSCSVTGSTVFDFEADGAAELVYGDECWMRIHDGTTGDVLWSHPRDSATWMESPLVADVDGDFRAEMIVPGARSGRPCPAIDPAHGGVRCATAADCPSGTCDAGRCRCAMDADCGDPELACAAPLPGDPGAGDVCRARFGGWTGLRVYGDVRDRWAGSRPIWNQHGYFVTHVDDDGTIPATPARHWESINGVRQNVQGALGVASSADLTVRGLDYGRDCTAADPRLPLRARVCNRGGLGIAPGAAVVFYDGDPATGGSEVCRTETTRPLEPGECEEVGCTWTAPPVDTPIDVFIAVDADGALDECRERNNEGSLRARCPPPLE